MNKFFFKNKLFFLRLKHSINRISKLEVLSYPTPLLKRRIKLLEHNKIDVVLDVGANIGQYGLELRNIGYKGRIISFEPTKNAFRKLESISKKDENWDVFNISLGEFDGETFINLSENSVSSSLLESLPQLEEVAPRAKFINREKIKINRLDTIFCSLGINDSNIFLKMDTQGYEKNIIEGAKESLLNVNGIQLEMSLVPTYQGAPNFDEMYNLICNKLGFEIQTLESGYYNSNTGQLLEVDGIFFRK